MRVTVLGSGSSTGTPSIEAGWGKCDPNNAKNRRTRPSILVEKGATAVLVDTSPDLREQLLRHDVKRLDGVVYTHAHADHLHGIDDLRGINRLMNAPIKAFADAATLASIRQRFGYVLEPLAAEATMYYKTTLDACEFAHGDIFTIPSPGAEGKEPADDVTITAIEQDHAYVKTFGLRFGDFAYSTDLIAMHKDAFDLLKGIKVWMLGTFTDRAHPTHLDIDRALEWCERVQPERAYFTHLGFGLDYATVQKRLPKNVFVAYDGLTIDI